MSIPQTTADVFRLGLSVGLFTPAEIIAWVDAEIVRVEEPPQELIALSLSVNSDPRDVWCLLRDLGGDHTPEPSKIVLGELSQRLRESTMTPMEVARAVDNLGDIPEDGHWPDFLANASPDEKPSVVRKLARHLAQFETHAAEWRMTLHHT